MPLRLLILSLVLLSTSALADPHTFDHAGRLKVADATERDATLHISCTPEAGGGAISIELVIPEANTRKDFDYDDFEGPDAAAASKALSQITWTSSAGATPITHVASGWYSPDPPQSFRFGVSQLSHHREPPAQLLGAIRQAGALVWTQSAADASGARLVATFALDAAAAQRLHDAVATCLPQNMPTRKPGG